MTKPTSTHTSAPPPVLDHAGDLLQRYDVLFCDVWGVLHNGARPYVNACDALVRFRAQGGTVVLLTNAPAPKAGIVSFLDSVDVPHETWDDIVASGDIALRHIAEKGYRRVFCLGPEDRDSATFDALEAERVEFENAEVILCTGLLDDENETADDYRPLLERALTRKLPFVCANPDLVVDIDGHHFLCAGAIADLYERMDGDVFWAGKPHASTYITARAVAEAARGGPVSRERILVIGDSLRTDLKGAEAAGIDAIFVASGIHRDETMGSETLSPEKVAALFAPPAPPALAIMHELCW